MGRFWTPLKPLKRVTKEPRYAWEACLSRWRAGEIRNHTASDFFSHGLIQNLCGAGSMQSHNQTKSSDLTNLLAHKSFVFLVPAPDPPMKASEGQHSLGIR
jgi:hypothetical protein